MVRTTNSSFRATILAVASAFAGLLCNASAQMETASVRGSVTDSSGALIANATVRLIDSDRGPTSQVTTGNDGFYRLSSVRPGRYQMEVEKDRKSVV